VLEESDDGEFVALKYRALPQAGVVPLQGDAALLEALTVEDFTVVEHFECPVGPSEWPDTLDGEDPDDPFRGPPETPPVQEEAEVRSNGTYWGIQPPPMGLRVEWAGGWFTSQLASDGEAPSAARLITQAIRGTCLNRLMSRPTYVSATVPNFQRWGSRATYVPVRLEGGLQTAGRRSVTDGCESVEFFTAGDGLRCLDARWSVRRDGDFLRVVCANVAAKACMRLWSVQVAPTAAELPAEQARKAGWLNVIAKEKEPVVTSVLSRFKADEAKEDYPGRVHPDDAVAVARAIVDRGRYQQVGAPFLWGYCYSCGCSIKDAKGQLKHRLCRQCERGGNTELGQLVQAGRKVTSVANPHVYAGVVNTLSRHPRLKPGVQSVASERNFRWPHQA